MEVARFAIQKKKFANVGFLNGPYCPIYGFGIIGVLLLLSPLKNNLPLFFICSVILTSALEFIVGYILEKLFHQKWWNYDGYFLNIKGYICLYVSIIWGIACIIIVHFLQPLIDEVILHFPKNIGLVVITIVLIAILADTVVALVSILKIRHKFVLLNEISEKMDDLSNFIGQNIADGAMSIQKHNDKNMKDLDELKENYKIILNKKVIGYNRIFRAYPMLQLDNPFKAVPKNKRKTKK